MNPRVPGGPILCTGITFAALQRVAGPRPFRSRDRVSPGGAQGVSQGGIWGSIWGSRRGDTGSNSDLPVEILDKLLITSQQRNNNNTIERHRIERRIAAHRTRSITSTPGTYR